MPSAISEDLQIEQLHSTFAAKVHGIDWSKPISDNVIEQVQKAIDQYGVLIFPNTDIDNDTQVAFTSRFGELDYSPAANLGRKGRFTGESAKYIFDVSNIGEDGEIRKAQDTTAALFSKGNGLWHCDMQYHPRRDKYSLLRAVEIPPKGVGGETEYADARTMYDDLSPEWKEKLEDVVVNCSLLHNRRAGAPELYKGVDPYDWPISRWKAVYPHEGSGRKSLYLTSYCWQIDGYSIDESQKIAQELLAHGSQPKYVYKVEWNQGDMVMWDNTAVWHRALDASQYTFKYRRDVRRTNTLDSGLYAWGDNDPNNPWRIKLPADPFAHEKAPA